MLKRQKENCKSTNKKLVTIQFIYPNIKLCLEKLVLAVPSVNNVKLGYLYL